MQEVDLLIRHAFIITQNRQGDLYPDGAVAIRGTDVVAVGPAADVDAQYQAKRVLDAQGQCVFPGLINTHTHLFQTFMKGLGEGIHVHSWLRAVTTPGILQMEPRDFYLSAMIGCLDAIRSGTTTLVEYMYPNPHHEVGDVILAALVNSGMRALLGRSVADIGDNDGYPRTAYYADLLEPLPQAMDDCTRLLKECQLRGQGRIGFCLAPPNMRCIQPETFAVFQDFARAHGCIITMHICETPVDDEIMRARHGKLAIQWLEEIGFLEPNVLAVHCVNLVDDGIARFATNDVKVSYNPVSNMYLGNGAPPIPALAERGVVIGLATDGASSNNTQDMLEAMKSGVLLQRAVTRNPRVLSGQDAMRMATTDAAKAVGLAGVTGSIEPGMKADLVIANLLKAKSAPFYDPINTLVFSADPGVVDCMVIDGRMVLEHGRFTAIDEEALVREAQAAGHHLARRSFAPEVLRTCRALPTKEN